MKAMRRLRMSLTMKMTMARHNPNSCPIRRQPLVALFAIDSQLFDRTRTLARSYVAVVALALRAVFEG